MRTDRLRRALLRALAASCVLGCAGAAQAHDFRIGELVIDHPYALPSDGVERVFVHFKSIRNRGGQPDRLIGANSPAAARAQLEHLDANGQAQVVPTVALPAGQTVSFRHDGPYRVALSGLTQALTDGDRLTLELRFEQAGVRQVPVWIQTPRQGGAQKP